jgi:hypothetical protein
MIKFTCTKCAVEFDDCRYWFDSLYFEKFDHREIKPFCGPICVDAWHKENNVKDWALSFSDDFDIQVEAKGKNMASEQLYRQREKISS